MVSSSHRARVGEPGLAQRVQTALGEREIDRAAAEETVHARIGPAFENFDTESPLRQQRSQQRTDQSGADDRD